MDYDFEGRMEGEEVVFYARQHPFIMLRPFLIAVAILLIPFLLNSFLAPGSLLSDSVVLCVILAIAQMARHWHAWSNSVLLLTNRRVIIVRQKSITHREVIGSGLTHIHRVIHEINGIFPSLFNYGTLSILTDDMQSALTIPAISRPFEIQQDILAAVDKAELATH